MGWKGVVGCGQGPLDDLEYGTVNNGQSNFPEYMAFGGCVATAAISNGAATSEQLNYTMPGGAWLFSGSAYVASNLTLRNYKDSPSTSGAAGSVPGRTHDMKYYITNDDGTFQGQQLLTFLSYANNGNKTYTVPTRWTDSTGQDSILVGQRVSMAANYGGLPGAGAGPFGGLFGTVSLFMESDHPGGVSIPWAINPASQTVGIMGSATFANRFAPVCGSSAAKTIVGDAQSIIPVAGVWDGFQVSLVGTPPGDAGKLRFIGSDVESSFNAGSTTTPTTHLSFDGTASGVLHNDTSETSVLFGQLACVQYWGQSGIGISHYQSFGSRFTSARPNVTPMIAAGVNSSSSGSATTPAAFSCGYCAPRLGFGVGAIENIAYANVASVMSNLSILCGTVSTGSPVASFQINGVQGHALVQVSATAGVIVYDSTAEDSVLVTQQYYIIFPAASGGLPVGWKLNCASYALQTPDGTGGMSLGL